MAHPEAQSLKGSWNDGIIEWAGLERTFKGHRVQPAATDRDIFTQSKLLKAPSNVALDVSKDEASSTSLGSLFLAFSTLRVKSLPHGGMSWMTV